MQRTPYIQDIWDFIRSHYSTGDTFTSGDIKTKAPWTARNMSRLSGTLRALNDKGLLVETRRIGPIIVWKLKTAEEVRFKYNGPLDVHKNVPGRLPGSKNIRQSVKVPEDPIDTIINALAEIESRLNKVDLSQVPETELWREIKRRREAKKEAS